MLPRVRPVAPFTTLAEVATMLRSIRSRLLSGVAVVSVAVGARYQLHEIHSVGQVAEPVRKDEFISLGAYKLHAVLAGRLKPVVVFVSGMGDNASSWDKVQPAIAALTSTIAYDRPGLGKSDPAPELHDLKASAVELHALLQALGWPPPYLLVGHSMGGFIIRVFAFTYPRETAALVLVDPSDEHFPDRLRETGPKAQWDSYRE